MSFVPRVFAFADGGEAVEEAGQLWDASSWMPGMPPERPTSVDVETAMAAIAELHSVWRGESVMILCPGVRSRARLMRELVSMEERRRTGKPKPKDAERRPVVMAELERVLAALDDEAPGGGQGAAA